MEYRSILLTYCAAMKGVCEKYGALFILDEVMSGMGRMGTLHGWQSLGDNCAVRRIFAGPSVTI
jgi:adenosylmethionine-8-amino-7-oxononanoate aminotransferase